MNKDQWFKSALSLIALGFVAMPSAQAESYAQLQANSFSMIESNTEANVFAGSQATTNFNSQSGRENRTEATFQAQGPANMNYEVLANPQIIVPNRPHGWGSKSNLYFGGEYAYSDAWGSNPQGYLTPWRNSPAAARPARVPKMHIHETGVPVSNFRLAQKPARVAPGVWRSTRTETLVQTEGPSINRQYAYVRSGSTM